MSYNNSPQPTSENNSTCLKDYTDSLFDFKTGVYSKFMSQGTTVYAKSYNETSKII